MGMSASQARYLGLIARQNDLEYQGQQINQERTVLSQQVTDLYNSLQTLNVPTPPSTSDFTEIQYKGSDGAANFTLGKIVPSGSTYSVTLDYKKTGNSTYSVGKAEITDVPPTINVAEITTAEKSPKTNELAVVEGQVSVNDDALPNNTTILHKVNSSSDIKETDGDIFLMQNGKLVKTAKDGLSTEDFKNGVYVERKSEVTTDEEGNETRNYSTGDYIYTGNTVPETINPGISRNELSKYYVVDGDKLEHAKETDFHYNSETGIFEFEGKQYFKLSDEGAPKGNPDYIEGEGQALNGNPLMKWDTGKKRLTDEQQKSAIEALRNGFPEYTSDSDDELLDRFFVSFSTEGGLAVPHFTLKNEVTNETGNTSKTKWATFYDITASGTYTQSVKVDDCQLTFDTSGRITKIQIPTTDSKTGKIIYRDIDLEATTVTDEKAYKDAYAKYEHSKYEYDKEQQEINAKTEVIQQEDKKLELKLTRLDNERTQITTELEAVKKVITDNIDKTYKTFSG